MPDPNNPDSADAGKSAHSPEPWRIEHCCEEDADSPMIWADGDPIMSMIDTGDREETWANARLVVDAAKTKRQRDLLLAALVDIVNASDEAADENSFAGVAYHKALAAIAKAEGRDDG